MKIYIVSGEGVQETIEEYDGKHTERAILKRLEEERCNGDRWAFVEINEFRVNDEDIADVIRCHEGGAEI